jgi:hypothetical protein
VDEYTYTVVISGQVESFDRLLEMVEGWTLHEGAQIVNATLSKSPPVGLLPYTVPPDGHARLTGGS